MKKIIRVVWIGALSGLAFLMACASSNGLSRKERRQLVKEREQVLEELIEYQHQPEFYEMEEFLAFNQHYYALENRLDAINFRLGDTIDLDRNYRRRQILQRIDSLNFLIGSYRADYPEDEEPIDPELDRLYQELEQAEDELDAIDGIDEKETPYEVLYGSPDMRIKPVEQRVVSPENQGE